MVTKNYIAEKFIEAVRDVNTDILGNLGEGIVYEHLINKFNDKNGFEIEWEGIHKFDSKKDMLIVSIENNKSRTVEVKTQVPFITKKSFTIRKNQIDKCKNVDLLFFVSVSDPSWPSEYEHFNKIFLCDNPSKLIIAKDAFKTKAGNDMHLIPIEQPGMHYIKTIKDDKKILLEKYSVSGSFEKDIAKSITGITSFTESSIEKWVDSYISENKNLLSYYREYLITSIITKLAKLSKNNVYV